MLSKQSMSRNIIVYDEEQKENYHKQSEIKVHRTLHCVFSPYIATSWCNFQISDAGIHGVEQTDPSQFEWKESDEQSVEIEEDEKETDENEKHDIFNGMDEQEWGAIFANDSEEWQQARVTDIDPNSNRNCNGDEMDVDFNFDANNNANIASYSPMQFMRTSTNEK